MVNADIERSSLPIVLNSRKGKNVKAAERRMILKGEREGCARRDGGGCSVRGR